MAAFPTVQHFCVVKGRQRQHKVSRVSVRSTVTVCFWFHFSKFRSKGSDLAEFHAYLRNTDGLRITGVWSLQPGVMEMHSRIFQHWQCVWHSYHFRHVCVRRGLVTVLSDLCLFCVRKLFFTFTLTSARWDRKVKDLCVRPWCSGTG